MNMEKNPTAEELRELLKACDDRAGHHLLWVAKNGEVHVSRVPNNQTPAEFQEDSPDMQLWCETFQPGNEYVGPKAAADNEWISQLFAALTKDWPKAKSKKVVEYIDQL